MPFKVASVLELLRALEFHSELRVLDAQRHPFGIELFVPLVLLDLTANLTDTVLANILSPTAHIKGVAELIVRPCLLLWIFVLSG